MTKPSTKLNTTGIIRELASEFFKYKIMEIKDIQLSSGKKSPYYMDMRMILSYPSILNSVINLLADGIREKHAAGFDKIASVPVGATPFASQLAFNMNKPSVLIREQAKSYGNKRMIEGKLSIDDKVILIEDVITTGASVIKTIHKLKNRGAEVVGVWALVNREEGGVENINYEFPDIPVHTLFTTTSIFTPLVKDKLVNQYDWERIRFFQESQIKAMICDLRERNSMKNKIPQWEENQVEYFMTNFPYWLALQRTNCSNLILSLNNTKQQDADKIINLFVKNKVQIPLIYTNGTNVSQEKLELLHRTTGARVIRDENLVLGWNHSHFLKMDKVKTVNPCVAEITSNHVLISCLADIESVISNLSVHNQELTSQKIKFLNIEFNQTNAAELVNDDKIWDGLDKLVSNSKLTGNNLSLCGIAFKYSDMKLMTKKRLLWKKAPVCLWIDNWYLHPSMLTEQVALDYVDSWLSMKYVMERLHPWQIVCDTDVTTSSYPIIERIGQYSQIFKSDGLNRLISDVNKIPDIMEFNQIMLNQPSEDKIDKNSTSNTVNPSDPTKSNEITDNMETEPPKLTDAEINHNNALQYYKMAVWHLYRLRNPLPNALSTDQIQQEKTSSQVAQNSPKLRRLTTRDICQNVFNYFTRPLFDTYHQFVAQIVVDTKNTDKNK